jgi:hypothetical protein
LSGYSIDPDSSAHSTLVSWQFKLASRPQDGSSVDMKSGLRELTELSLLAACCCGLAWAHGDTFFATVFGGASAMTIIEAIRRSL